MGHTLRNECFRIQEYRDYFFKLSVHGNRLCALNRDGWLRIYEDGGLKYSRSFGKGNLREICAGEEGIYMGTRSGHLYLIQGETPVLIYGIAFYSWVRMLRESFENVSNIYRSGAFLQDGTLHYAGHRIKCDSRPVDVDWDERCVYILDAKRLIVIDGSGSDPSLIDIESRFSDKSIYASLRVTDRTIILSNRAAVLYVCRHCLRKTRRVSISKITTVHGDYIGTENGWVFDGRSTCKISDHSICSILETAGGVSAADYKNTLYCIGTPAADRMVACGSEQANQNAEVVCGIETPGTAHGECHTSLPDVTVCAPSCLRAPLFRTNEAGNGLIPGDSGVPTALPVSKNTMITKNNQVYDKKGRRLCIYALKKRVSTEILFFNFTALDRTGCFSLLGTENGDVFLTRQNKEIVDVITLSGKVISIHSMHKACAVQNGSSVYFVATNGGSVYLLKVHNSMIYIKKQVQTGSRIVSAYGRSVLLSNGQIVLYDDDLTALKTVSTSFYITLIYGSFIFYNGLISNIHNALFNGQDISGCGSAPVSSKNILSADAEDGYLFVCGDDHSIRKVSMDDSTTVSSVVAHCAQVFCVSCFNGLVYSLSSDMRIGVFTLDLVPVKYLSHGVRDPRILDFISAHEVMVYGESVEVVEIG